MSYWLKLLDINKSSFYEWKQKLRQNIDRNDKYKEITSKIEEIFYDNDRDFGHKRIHIQLKLLGYKISKKKVLQIMKKTVEFLFITLLDVENTVLTKELSEPLLIT